MAIFGFKKRNDDKLQQTAATVKSAAKKPAKAPTKAIAKAPKAAKPTATKEVAVAKVAAPTGNFSGASDAIIRPRVTEKSGILSQSGRYTFEIATGANKDSVAKAVLALYKVKAVKVAIINSPSKNVFVKGRRGVVSGVRKAVVTVAKGDKIDFV